MPSQEFLDWFAPIKTVNKKQKLEKKIIEQGGFLKMPDGKIIPLKDSIELFTSQKKELKEKRIQAGLNGILKIMRLKKRLFWNHNKLKERLECEGTFFPFPATIKGRNSLHVIQEFLNSELGPDEPWIIFFQKGSNLRRRLDGWDEKRYMNEFKPAPNVVE